MVPWCHEGRVCVRVCRRLRARAGPVEPCGGRMTDDPRCPTCGQLDPVAQGRKGGRARAARLSPEARSEAARKAARVRWPLAPAPTDTPPTSDDDEPSAAEPDTR